MRRIKLLVLFCAILLTPWIVEASDYSQQQVWVTGETITATKLNQDIQGIINTINDLDNNNISAGANIAYSKLNLSGNIVNADVAAGAAIVDTKLAQITTADKVAATAVEDKFLRNDGDDYTSGSLTIDGDLSVNGIIKGQEVIKVHTYETATKASDTGTIPDYTTKPQITEGSQFMTTNYTPSYADSKLVIEAIIHGGNGAHQWYAAIHKTGTSDCLTSGISENVSDNYADQIYLKAELDPVGTTSQITISVRAGSTADTTYINASPNGTYDLGESMVSGITIYEIKAA